MTMFSAVDSNGQVLYRGDGDDPGVLAVDGVAVVYALPPSDRHYWAGAWVDMGTAPSPVHTWDWTTHQWVDARTLSAAKETRWEAMKAARDAAEFGGFTWDGSDFDSGPMSQSRIQGAALMATLAAQAGQPFSIDWTLADNTVRTLSGADMIAAGQAMALHIEAQHETGRAVRAAIMAATTLAEVDAVQWPA